MVTATIDARTRVPDSAELIGMWPAAQPQWLVGVLLEFDHSKDAPMGRAAVPLFNELVAASSGAMAVSSRELRKGLHFQM